MDSESPAPRPGGLRPRKSRIAALPAALVLLLALVSPLSCGPRLVQRELIISRNGETPVPVRVELARTAEEKARGLMYRKNLNDGTGMLFIFDQDEILSFWMKNTYIPLSIAYIAKDGRILEIRNMRPHDETPVRSSRSARYALEVPQGWFSRAGIAPGDILALDEDLR
jgi:uncharacterized membrane protein (UPF0127 family)